MFYYVVTCRFEGTDPTLSEKWLTWLIPGHIDDVLQAGAVSAEILRLDDEMPHFQINYGLIRARTFSDMSATTHPACAPKVSPDSLWNWD
jgi:hypothetical protein